MSCLHPIYAWVNGTDPFTGKLKLTFKPDSLYNDDERKRRQIELPCGQCVECRLQYSRLWADRCLMELQDHDPDSCWFLTLTYNDDHIHLCDKFCNDPKTGEAVGLPVPMLRPDHLTQFWKDLRREFPDDHIRYFAAGEYGEHPAEGQFPRPHYHAIVYGLNLRWKDSDGTLLDDLKFYKFNRLNEPLWTSKGRLQKCWKYGYVVIGRVTWRSCAYVARYILKKQKGSAFNELQAKGYVPEFVRMSRRPGIGKNFIESHERDFKEFGEVYLSCDGESICVREPRYSKRLRDNHELYDSDFKYNALVQGMERIEDRRSSILSKTDLSEIAYASQAEVRARDRAQRLRRL